MIWPHSIERLIRELQKLPGVGPRTAQRLAFFLLHVPTAEAGALADAIREVKEQVRYCDICYTFAEGSRCPICLDDRRDRSTICVVEDPRDVYAIERTHEYRGLYHVLHGAISPIDGVGPDKLRIAELMRRLKDHEVDEIIIATNPTVEGEATAMYLARLLKEQGHTVTRIASGLPAGGDLDYADEVTLGRALEGRRPL